MPTTDRLRRLCHALAALAVLATPALAAGAPSLRVALPAAPASLDPHQATAIGDMRILHDLCEGLVASDASGLPVPGLADRWTVSPDGLTYSFSLRPGARWSDGRPVTAEDFVYSWRRAVDPRALPGNAEVLFPVAGAREVAAGTAPPEALAVSAPDPATFVVRLARPFAEFLSWTALSTQAMPVDRQAVERLGAGFTRPGAFTCTGAYRLAALSPQEKAVLEANPHYHGPAPAVARVEYLFVEDEEMQVKRYRAGELDATYGMPAGQLDWARAHLAADLRFNPLAATTLLEFNLRAGPWSRRPDLRRALALAIDRELLASRIAGGGERPAHGILPPDLLPGTPGPASIPADAKAALAEARRIVAAAGPLPPVEVLYNSSQVNRRVLVAVAAMWKQGLGVETRLTNLETKALLARRQAGDVPGLLRVSWVETLPLAYLQRLLPATEPGGFDLGYRNPAFAALVDQAGQAPDPAAARRLLREAEAVAMADMPVIPLYHPVIARLVSPRVAGWRENPADIHPSRLLAWR